jgi:nitrite reductase/ring-hydroxylating ferredoxin subunit
MNSKNALCQLDDIPLNASKAFTHPQDPKTEVFVVRTADGVYGYYNSCPHTGGPLDWMPDQFLSHDKKTIQCATHDAHFKIENGRCVAGPCVGEFLKPVSLEVISGEIFLRSN